MSIFTKIFGDPNEKVIKELRKKIAKVNDSEETIHALSDDELKEKTAQFKKALQDGKTLDDIWAEVFAVVREAANRVLGERHFDVQLVGGLVLHEGQIAEMRTGEGKTLTATLAVYLNALQDKGAHVITVNDYLAKRDTNWMGKIYNFLGLTIGCLQHQLSYLYDRSIEGEYQLREVNRKQAYEADITYGTNNEFGFDYLRDHMAQRIEDKVQRELNFAIVDEVDSILIDEARTPLIISAPAEESAKQYYQFAQLVTRLKENEDYNKDEKMRAATLTEEGISKMEKWLGVENIYTSGGLKTVHHIEQALKAHALFTRDKDYVVKDNQVIIVDEFTGRLMPGRRYSEGLHQALEAKEGLPIARESVTLASITFQNYFRLYKKLSGMTGTAMTEAEEFAKIYNLEVTAIPTHKPMIRKDVTDIIYKTEKAKYEAVVKEVSERHKKGQPILIGTISIEKNELLANLLQNAGLPYKMLNAKQHETEAKIIEDAGRVGAITVATNMAGRGVDIVLGGVPYDDGGAKKVKDAGGLTVIGTERHEARRIDNQLRGRSGRQGDPGASRFFISLEDDLMRIFAGDKMKNIMTRLKVPEDMPIENRMIAKSIESAQGKVEGHNFDIRKHLVEYDDVINKHREVIYKNRNEVLYNFKFEPAANTKSIRLSIEEEIEQVVSFHTSSDKIDDWNIGEIWQVMRTIFPIEKSGELNIEDLTKATGSKFDLVKQRTHLINHINKLARARYDEMTEQVNDAMKEDFAGKGMLPMQYLEKAVLLRSIDTLWVEHLEAIDYLRTGIGLRGYGQRDPLIEYKKESYRLFTGLVNLINKQTAYTIYKVASVQQFAPSIMQSREQTLKAPAKVMASGDSAIAQAAKGHAAERTTRDAIAPKARDKSGKKIGRNDPCPCGATKPDGTPIKYKKCHGQ